MFGIIMDGWDDMPTSTKYVALFAVNQSINKAETRLLVFSPLPDEKRYDASVHCDFVNNIFQVFNKSPLKWYISYRRQRKLEQF